MKKYTCSIEIPDLPSRHAREVARERGYDLNMYPPADAMRTFRFETDDLPVAEDTLHITQAPPPSDNLRMFSGADFQVRVRVTKRTFILREHDDAATSQQPVQLEGVQVG